MHAVREEIRAEQQGLTGKVKPASTRRVSTLKRMLTQTDEQGRTLTDEEVSNDAGIHVCDAVVAAAKTRLECVM